jgi:leucyl aminopeptidase
MKYITTALLVSLLPLTLSKPLLIQSQDQHLLSSTLSDKHQPHPSILSALSIHSDPVDALLSLRPELIDHLNSERLIQVFDGTSDPNPVWLTEGDKLRLRREGKGFMDVTQNWELYQNVKQSGGLIAGHARK